MVALIICLTSIQGTNALNVPEEELEFNGDLFGLIHETGKEIVKTKYAYGLCSPDGKLVVIKR